MRSVASRALAGVILLGPRLGKYLPGGKMKPILGHSMPLATIGVFLLLLGWFGFNGGSVLQCGSRTRVAGVCNDRAGRRGRRFVIDNRGLDPAEEARSVDGPERSPGRPGRHHRRRRFGQRAVGRADRSDRRRVWSSVPILFFDKIKIDDPVGAISVHGICGIWGTLAVGLFGNSEVSLVTQLIGTLSARPLRSSVSPVLFIVVKVTIGIRVSPEEETGVSTSASTVWRPIPISVR